MTHGLDDALVEKVARAIAGVCFETGWDDLAEGTRACFFPYARAALEAAGVAELREALGAISSQAICYGMRADETELRDWLKFISETAESAFTNQGKAQG